MHGHWYIPLGQQEHAVFVSALHFIQIIWFTYRTSLFTFTGCTSGFNLQNAA